MKQSLLLLLLFFTNVLAYNDSDFDGVADNLDRCPNTPFSELVDIQGCTIKRLVSPHNFDFIVGMSYSSSDYQTLNATDTLTTTLQTDYYYKNFSMQLSTSFYKTEGSDYSDSGINDSFIGFAYSFKPLEKLSVRVGIGALLPTYNTSLSNNNTDFVRSLNLSYTQKEYTLFSGISYTQIRDDDTTILYADNTTQEITYQDTSALSLGVGHYMSAKLYTSLAYNWSESVYTSVEAIQTASLYGYYNISKEYFTTVSYSYGLSDSASQHYLSLRFGYLF